VKKGKYILLAVCAAALLLIMGIFIGRNFRSNFVQIPKSDELRATSETAEVSDGLLDINKATKAQLIALPGIGEVLADRIIAYRAEIGLYTSCDDLLNVDGIGQKTLEEIAYLIKAGG